MLVDRGLLTPTGEKRGRFYVRAGPLLEIDRDLRAVRAARSTEDPFQLASEAVVPPSASPLADVGGSTLQVAFNGHRSSQGGSGVARADDACTLGAHSETRAGRTGKASTRGADNSAFDSDDAVAARGLEDGSDERSFDATGRHGGRDRNGPRRDASPIQHPCGGRQVRVRAGWLELRQRRRYRGGHRRQCLRGRRLQRPGRLRSRLIDPDHRGPGRHGRLRGQVRSDWGPGVGFWPRGHRAG